MADFGHETNASNALFDNTAVGLRLGVPDPYQGSLPSPGTPAVSPQLQRSRQMLQDTFNAAPQQQATAAPSTVGYNPATDEIFSNGNLYKAGDLVQLLKADKLGDLNGSKIPPPQGFNTADPAQFKARITNTPDWQKEWGAATRNYGAGFAAIGAAAGSDASMGKFQQLSGDAELLGGSSSAPQEFKDVEFGKNFLPYIRRLGIGSIPYMAEAMVTGFGLGSLFKGGGVAAAKQFAEKAIAEEAKVIMGRAVGGRITEEAALVQAANNVGKGFARSGGMVAGTYPSAVGDVLSNQYEQNKTFDLPSAAGLGVPYAGLNLLGMEGMLSGGNMLRRSVGTPSSLKAGARGALGFAEVTGGEAINESGQEVLNQAGRVAVDPTASMTSPEALARYKESAIGGAFIGSLGGAVHGARSAIHPTDSEQDLLKRVDANKARWDVEDIQAEGAVQDKDAETRGASWMGKTPGVAPAPTITPPPPPPPAGPLQQVETTGMNPAQGQAYGAALSELNGLPEQQGPSFAMEAGMRNAAPGETYDFIAQQATPTPTAQPSAEIPPTPQQQRYGTQFEPGSAEGLRQQLNQQQAAGDVEDIRTAAGDLKNGKPVKAAVTRAQQKAFDNQETAEATQDTVDTPQGVLPFSSPMEGWKERIEKVAKKHSAAGFLIRKALKHDNEQDAAKAIREQSYKLRPARAADTSEKAQSTMLIKLKALNSAHTVLTGKGIAEFVAGGSEAEKFARLTEGLTDKQRLYFAAAIGEGTGKKPDSQVQMSIDIKMRQDKVSKLGKSTEAALAKVAKGIVLSKREARGLFEKARNGQLSTLPTELKTKLEAALEEFNAQNVTLEEQASQEQEVTPAVRYDEAGGEGTGQSVLAQMGVWTNSTLGKSTKTGDSSRPSAHAQRAYTKEAKGLPGARAWKDLSHAEQMHISEGLRSALSQPKAHGEVTNEETEQNKELGAAMDNETELEQEVADLQAQVDALEESKDEDGADKKAINAELRPIKKELKAKEAELAGVAAAVETASAAIGESTPAGKVKADTLRAIREIAQSKEPIFETSRPEDTPIENAKGNEGVVEKNEDMEVPLLERVGERLTGIKLKPKMDVGIELENAIEEWTETNIADDPAWDELTLDEQEAWAVNYIRWKSDHVGYSAPGQFKDNLVRAHNENKGKQQARTVASAPKGAGETKQTEAAPPTGVQAALAGAKEKASRGPVQTLKGKLHKVWMENSERVVNGLEMLKKEGVDTTDFEKRFATIKALQSTQAKVDAVAGLLNDMTAEYKPTKKARAGEKPENGLSLGTVQKIVQELKKRFPKAPMIHVVRNEEVDESNKNDKGWYDTATNDITIVADMHTSPAEVVATVYHELKGHFGLAGAFNTELNTVLDDAYRNSNVKRQADVIMKEEGKTQREAVEEVLAETAISAKHQFLNKIKATIAKYARKWGMYKGFSNAEVMEILRSAREYVDNGGTPPTEGTGKKARSAAATAGDFEPKRTPMGAVRNALFGFKKFALQMREGSQIERENKKDLPAITALVDNMHARGAEGKRIMDMGVKILNTWNKFTKEQNERISKLLNDSTMHQFVVSEELDSDANRWLKEKQEAAEASKDDETKADVAAQIKEFNTQRASFLSAPAELQSVYKQVFDFTEQLAKEEFANKTSLVRSTFMPEILALATPAQRAAIEKVVLHDMPSMKEFAAYKQALTKILKGEEKGKVENQKALNRMREMAALMYDKMEGFHQRRGLYFPLLRFGDHIVTAMSKVFKETTEAVGKLKSEIHDFKRDNEAMQDAETLVAAAAEARDAARRRLSSTAGAAYATAKKALADFKKSDAYKEANKELGELRKELKNKTKELAKMARNKNHYAFHREENYDFALQRQKNYEAKEMIAYTKLADEWLGELDTVSTSFSNKLTKKLTDQFKNDSAMQAKIEGSIKQIFTETQHDQSSLHRISMRRNIHGFNQDANRVFQSYLQQSAHRLASQKYFVPMQESLDKVREQAADKDKTGKHELTSVANELAIRNVMDMEYKETAIQDSIARYTQVMTLGASPAFLMQQTMQPWMLTLPYLAGKSSMVQATKALAGASSDAWRLLRESAKGSGLMNRFEVKLDDPKLTAGERAALHFSANRGLIDILLDHDVALGAKGKQLSKYDKFVEMTNWTGRQLEVTNRIATALAAYRLEMSRSNDQTKAERYAAEAVEQTQVDYSNENASRWTKRNAFTGSKVIMQFKKYQIHMIQMLLWNAKQSYAGGSKEERSEARKILVGMLTTHGMMAGSLGLPMAAPILFVAQLASFMWPDDDEPDPETAYKNFLADMMGKDVGDIVSKGLPAALGLDLSGKLGMGNVFNPIPFVRTDKQGKDLFKEMVLALLGPSVSVGGRFMDGAQALTDGDLQKAWTNMAPKYMSDPAKAFKMGTEGLTTKEGNVRIPADKFTVGDLTAIALGVPDLKVSKYYEYNAQFEDSKKAAAQVVAGLKKDWVKGDAAEKAEVRKSVAEFNARHPTDKITMKDLFAAQKLERTYQKNVTPEGLRVSKKTKEFAQELRF